jgi:acyl-CoA carboxylase subunit beta
VPVPAHLDSPGYRAERSATTAVSGADEAVASGEGRIGGHRLAVVASDFGFLAGSFGVAAAERFLLAVERATAERLPLLAVAASGGTRMQEGTPAFLQCPRSPRRSPSTG